MAWLAGVSIVAVLGISAAQGVLLAVVIIMVGCGAIAAGAYGLLCLWNEDKEDQ